MFKHEKSWLCKFQGGEGKYYLAPKQVAPFLSTDVPKIGQIVLVELNQLSLSIFEYME